MFLTTWIVDSSSNRRLALAREVQRLRESGWNAEEIADSVAYVFFNWTGRIGEVPELDVPEMSWDNLTFYAAEWTPCVFANDWGAEKGRLLAEIPSSLPLCLPVTSAGNF